MPVVERGFFVRGHLVAVEYRHHMVLYFPLEALVLEKQQLSALWLMEAEGQDLAVV